MSKYLSAKDIVAAQTKRQNKRSESFDQILDKCYKTIKRSVEVLRNNNNCFVEIPEFLIGYPLYDLNECIQFVVQKLTVNGFYVKYFFPRVLFISWAPPPKQALPAPPPVSTPTAKAPPRASKATNKTIKMAPTKQKGKFVLDLT
jgi:hypothetical protein